MIDPNVLLSNTCGRDDSGSPKATVLVALSMVSGDLENPEKEIIQELSSMTCEAQIFPTPQFVGIDLKFESNIDMDLQDFWKIITQYFDMTRNLPDDAAESPLLEVVIIPKAFNGQVFISAINPGFKALTADNPKRQFLNQITMAFNSDNNFFVVEPENFNAEEYIANAQRDAEAKFAQLEMDEIANMKGDTE